MAGRISRGIRVIVPRQERRANAFAFRICNLTACGGLGLVPWDSAAICKGPVSSSPIESGTPRLHAGGQLVNAAV